MHCTLEKKAFQDAVRGWKKPRKKQLDPLHAQWQLSYREGALQVTSFEKRDRVVVEGVEGDGAFSSLVDARTLWEIVSVLDRTPRFTLSLDRQKKTHARTVPGIDKRTILYTADEPSECLKVEQGRSTFWVWATCDPTDEELDAALAGSSTVKTTQSGSDAAPCARIGLRRLQAFFKAFPQKEGAVVLHRGKLVLVTAHEFVFLPLDDRRSNETLGLWDAGELVSAAHALAKGVRTDEDVRFYADASGGLEIRLRGKQHTIPSVVSLSLGVRSAPRERIFDLVESVVRDWDILHERNTVDGRVSLDDLRRMRVLKASIPAGETRPLVRLRGDEEGGSLAEIIRPDYASESLPRTTVPFLWNSKKTIPEVILPWRILRGVLALEEDLLLMRLRDAPRPSLFRAGDIGLSWMPFIS